MNSHSAIFKLLILSKETMKWKSHTLRWFIMLIMETVYQQTIIIKTEHHPVSGIQTASTPLTLSWGYTSSERNLCLFVPLPHLFHHPAFKHCPTHTEAVIIKMCTNNLTLVAKKACSQHFLLVDNTEAISAPLPASVITPLPPPWKLGAWLSIRQPGSSCVCCLPLWASQTRPPSPLQWIRTELLLVKCHKKLQDSDSEADRTNRAGYCAGACLIWWVTGNNGVI